MDIYKIHLKSDVGGVLVIIINILKNILINFVDSQIFEIPTIMGDKSYKKYKL